MKKILILSLFVMTVFMSQNAFSQSNKLSFAIFGGYSAPTAELKGEMDFKDFSAHMFANNYSMKSGFNVGGSAKYALDRMGNLQLTGSVIYNGFSRTADTVDAVNGSETADLKMNILSANIGAQYNFMPNHKVNPYVNVDFTNNFISGSSKVVTNNTTTSTDKSLKSAWRGGLQLGAGIDFAVSPNIGILVGGNYNFANLIGKDTTSSVGGTEYALNDKEYTPNPGASLISAKSISYIQLYAGVSIYMNRILRK
ncbi:hypothetical protein BH10BAC5_BH10BAC5_03600 [soil metagenome]